MTDEWLIQSYARIFDKAQPSETPFQWIGSRWMSGARQCVWYRVAKFYLQSAQIKKKVLHSMIIIYLLLLLNICIHYLRL